MLFRQLFEPQTSSYTYLVADRSTGEAALVDPVLEELERYRALVDELGLTLVWSLETHVHADHVTAADALRSCLGCRTALHRSSEASCADRLLVHGEGVAVGRIRLEVVETPGHTATCVSYLVSEGAEPADRVLTGDALLIGGCGRTDFQEGDPERLYDSVTKRLFALPPDTLVYPAHDYNGNTVSTIGQERAKNLRLGGGRSKEEFVALMRALKLPYPGQMDRAVPANQRCGRAG